MGFREHMKRSIKRSTATDWLLAFFTLALAFVAIYQFVIVKGQLHIMQTDQRPWINAKVDSFTEPPTINGNIQGIVHLSNTGKTPAKHVRCLSRIENIRNGEYPHFEYSTQPITYLFTGTILPDKQPVDIPVVSLDHIPSNPQNSEPKKFSDIEVGSLLNGGTFIVIHGRVDYEDILGVKHWITFCGWKGYNPQGQYSAYSCSQYNDVDNN